MLEIMSASSSAYVRDMFKGHTVRMGEETIVKYTPSRTSCNSCNSNSFTHTLPQRDGLDSAR
jgi:hypothetical protein